MFCALSGEAIEEPVVSTKSGSVFEKRVITKWLQTNGTDPTTQEPLSAEDLLPIKTKSVVKPRPTTATSIPSLLSLFQNEWDALMLETYTLKQQLESVRQELSHTLYQHDAACRVIARLIKERDDARNALAAVRGGAPAPAASESMESESTGISEAIREKMIAKSKVLSADRKTRQVSPTLAKVEDVKDYKPVQSLNLHKSSHPGVTAIDLHPEGDLVVTGGADNQVIVSSISGGKIVNTYSEHKKPITDVLFHPTENIAFSTSSDHTAKVWRLDEGKKSAFTVSTHTATVTGATLHPTGDYWVTSSLDTTWAFHDIAANRTIAQITSDSGLSYVTFHPDGLILATGGEDSSVKVWDIKAQKNVATFEGHRARVVDLSFSENGYYLATASSDNTVKLWDLRKLKNFHTINLPDGHNVSAVDFDYSGTYLAVAGNDIRVYVGKTLNHVATYTDHAAPVTDLKWGKDAHTLVSSSLDRSFKVWASRK